MGDLTLPGFDGFNRPAGSETDEWLTPQFVIDGLGGADSFDLDPASPVCRPWPTARAHYTEIDNGLLLPWRGRVFLNPPYSTGLLKAFMGRMAEHDQGVALIFARTQNAAWHDHVWPRASALFFFKGYLRFHRVDGSRAAQGAGAASVLCAYGQADAEILGDAPFEGQFVPLQLPRSFAVLALSPTWRQAVLAYLKAQRGPVSLEQLYRALGPSAKARRNPNYAAKIRQTVQKVGRRVDRGLWEAA